MRPSEGTQVERYGGTEALTLEDMQTFNDPAADTASTFMGQAPRNVSSRKSVLPGQRPWSAFKRGTQIILLLWSSSVVWAIVKAVLNIHSSYMQQLEDELLASTAVCQGFPDSWTSWPEFGQDPTVIDRGCGWARARSTSLKCDHGCWAALLQQGGRQVVLCQATKLRDAWVLTPRARWYTLGSPLKSLALDLRGNVTELYARSAEGGLLLLRPQGRRLRPILEVESSEAWSKERLKLEQDFLVSHRVQESSCTGLLVAWHLHSGARMEWRTDQCRKLQNLTGASCQ